jgi:hypothetical protein
MTNPIITVYWILFEIKFKPIKSSNLWSWLSVLRPQKFRVMWCINIHDIHKYPWESYFPNNSRLELSRKLLQIIVHMEMKKQKFWIRLSNCIIRWSSELRNPRSTWTAFHSSVHKVWCRKLAAVAHWFVWYYKPGTFMVRIFPDTAHLRRKLDKGQ